MKTVYIRKNASHFFKKGIALSLLIFAGLAAHANPSLHEAPPSLPLKGKVSSSASECTYALSATSNSVEADAGVDVTVTVTPTGTSCTAWTATVASNARWITITSGARGTGIGTVTYSYQANMSEIRRTGTLTIAGQTYTVTQAGRPLAPDRYEGDAGNNTPATAHLFAASFSPRLEPNAIASIDISSASCHEYGDWDYYKIELGTGYTYTLSGVLYDLNHQNDGSNYTLDVTISYSTNGAAWSATADFWLSPKTVPGGTLYLRIGPYSISKGTYAAKIDIRAGCRTFLPILRKTAPSGAGSDQITVISGSSCTSWTAASDADWLTFTGGARTAAGNLRYFYAANPTADLRTGAIIVAGQVYTVIQAPSPDSYEPNNTPAAVQQPNSPSSLTPTFEQNAGVIRISPANCHAANDVDIYKINLAPDYAYAIRGTLYDLGNQNGGSNYTLDVQISYSTDEGENWGYSYGSQFSNLSAQAA